MTSPVSSLASGGPLWVGHESATVIVHDVIFVFAGLANTSVGYCENIILVHIIVPGAGVSDILKTGWRRIQTTCEREYHWLSYHLRTTRERSA